MKGFSLLEALIFGALSCFALYCVSQLLIKPAQMQRTLNASEAPHEAVHALDILVNDLKSAAPGSIQWDTQSSTSPLVFAQSRFNPDTKKFDPVVMAYGYEGTESGPGRLMRVESDTTTMILQPIDPPTAATPLFFYDSALHVIMVDIRYHPAGKATMRLVRRVALSQ